MSTPSPRPLFPVAPADVARAESRLKAQRERIARAAAAAGRDPASVDLIAVGKFHPVEALSALYAAGHRHFGENYAQELAAKAPLLMAEAPDAVFSFIGAIQSNKLKLIVAHAAEAQTVASFEHAEKIARLAAGLNKNAFGIWLAVNAGDEATKSGLARSDAAPLAAAIAEKLPALAVRGLMAIPPPLTAAERAAAEPPPLYRELARLAAGIGAGGLSLGMSDDLEHAVKAGATAVRIGTALFGPRPTLLA